MAQILTKKKLQRDLHYNTGQHDTISIRYGNELCYRNTLINGYPKCRIYRNKITRSLIQINI